LAKAQEGEESEEPSGNLAASEEKPTSGSTLPALAKNMFAIQTTRVRTARLDLSLVKELDLGPIRPDPSGALCDNITGEALLTEGVRMLVLEDATIELLEPAHYRIRRGSVESFLRFSYDAWYYGVRTIEPCQTT
jgi:hypothetical protein